MAAFPFGPSLLASLAQTLCSASTGSTEGKAAAPVSYVCVICVCLCVCVSLQLKPQTPVSGNANPLLQWTVVSIVPLPVHPCQFSCLTYDVITILGRDFFFLSLSLFFFICQTELTVDVKWEFTPTSFDRLARVH